MMSDIRNFCESILLTLFLCKINPIPFIVYILIIFSSPLHVCLSLVALYLM